MLTKLKYHGIFNYSGEVHKLETEANSPKQAWRSFCYGLAKKCGVEIIVMYNYFNGRVDNYKIEVDNENKY